MTVLFLFLYFRRVEVRSPRENILASTDVATTILASTEGYVWRFVTLTVHGLTVPAPILTQAGGVRRRITQEPVKTSLVTSLWHLENTSSLIPQRNCSPFTVTWNQNQDLFGHWYNHFPWQIKTYFETILEVIFQWITAIMKWIGTRTACPYHRWNPLPITQHIYEPPVTSQQKVCSIPTTRALSLKVITYLAPGIMCVSYMNALTSGELSALTVPL